MNDKSYLTFTAAFPLDMAKKIFVKKFGEEPKTWFIQKRMLWMGPEPKQKLSSEKIAKAA